MRFRTSSIRNVAFIFILVSFALVAHGAPKSPYQLSTAQEIATSSPPSSTLAMTKRMMGQHTIANGWKIKYQVINFITPAAFSLLHLRDFYLKILEDVQRRIVADETPSAVAEISIGQFTLSFLAEQGFMNAVPWDIIFEFVDQLMDGTVPMTFRCHVSPPGNTAGIMIKLWVGKSL